MKNVLTLLFLVFCVVASGQIINFPDAYFKYALVSTKCVDTDDDKVPDMDADVNDDWEIDVEEALQIKRLDVSSQNIISLDRIEEFKNLKFLSCDNNKLTSIALDKLIKLERLNIRNNQITTLELKTLINLEKLELSNNQLNNLNLEGLTNLFTLDCIGNGLVTLNLQGCTNLRIAIVSNNKIETLNLQGIVELSLFSCRNNLLKTLYMKTTKVSNLNFEENPLEYICCDEEKITKIKDMTIANGQNCEVNSECNVTNTQDLYTNINTYPNPVSDILQLDTNDHWSKAEIYDLAGRIMRSISFNGQSMDVSGLESGTYFIRLKDGEKVGLVKFVKI